VIADEAHSSQTGEAAAKLKAGAVAEELAELEDGGEVSTEDLLAAQMAARADDSRHHLRGLHRHAQGQDAGAVRHAPDPTPAGARQPAGAVPRLLDAPGHRGGLHPRRAAELHALQAGLQAGHDGKEYDEKEVERSAAMKGIMGWVRCTPTTSPEGADRRRALPRERAPLLDGKAKAMVVVGSRKEAVRWKLAIDKYIKPTGYKIGTLVAFSGEVNDPESGPSRSPRPASC
jgi:type I restriction enzyme, R subunit